MCSRRIGWFEIGQVAVLAALGIGTMLRLWPTTAMAVTLGAACLLFAAGFYAAAGLRVIRLPERNARAFAVFGLLLALTGLWLLASGLVLAAMWCTLALAVTTLGQRWRRDMLSLHGALYLAAAAIVSDLASWPAPPASSALLGIAAALVYALTLIMRPRASVPWPDRVPSFISAAVLCWSLVGLTTGSALSAHFSDALTSTLRTIAISAIALALAWFGSRRGLTELLWLLSPWMTFGAVKLLFEDFGKGRSATLFVSLLVYGAVLIALPRLLRHAKPGASDLS